MKVLDPGHLYALDLLDADVHDSATIRFVKRIGNEPPAYAGVTTQEVLRALIDRQKYVDRQRPNVANRLVLSSPRAALRWLEVRAAEERDDDAAAAVIIDLQEPELEPTCAGCGHLMCTRSHP